MKFLFQGVVHCFRRIVVGLSHQKPAFDPGPVHARFMADRVVVLRVLRFPCVSVLCSVLRTRVHLHAYSGQDDGQAKPGTLR